MGSLISLLLKIINLFGIFKTIKTAFTLWRLKREVSTMDAKGILQSKTIWGIIVSLIALGLKHYNITVDEAGLTNDIVVVLGSIFSVYGRLVADKKITGLLQ